MTRRDPGENHSHVFLARASDILCTIMNIRALTYAISAEV